MSYAERTYKQQQQNNCQSLLNTTTTTTTTTTNNNNNNNNANTQIWNRVPTRPDPVVECFEGATA